MVRATYARVLVRLLGERPTSVTEAQITALCTQADYIIDRYTNPRVMSTTSNLAIEIAVDVVLRMIRQGEMLRHSSGASTMEGVTYPDVVILTNDIKHDIDAMLNESYYLVATVDGV